MITLFFKRAVDDILKNRFLNLITVITISLSVLIVCAFFLFFINTSEIINSWKKGLRMMAYLKSGLNHTELADLKRALASLEGVQSVRFISREEALSQLKAQMERQASIFENLGQNPLPDAFEIRMAAASDSWQQIESLAARVESLTQVEEAEYGQRWIGRFVHLISLFRLAGYAMGALFFMATVFIVANTMRLVIYARREEVDIMRLVGATDSFIKIPFYLEGIIQGGLGAAVGLAALYIAFFLISSSLQQGFFPGPFRLQFFSLDLSAAIILGSMLVGWLGCYISLKQFLRV
jgi:cell division transport system permease protein